jgi:GntR family transcriptional regulator
MTVEQASSRIDSQTEPWDMSVEDTPLSRIPGVPLYVQIRESLRRSIDRGLLEPGRRIPSEEELAARYGVSRMTVRKAIADLTDAGLLYTTHGVGTFVAHTQLIRDHSRLTDFPNDPSLEGMEPKVQVLAIVVIPARARIAKLLALPEGEPVLRIDTLRLLDGIPVTVSSEYTSRRLFPQHLESELASHSVWAIHERNGLKVARAVERLEARPAPPASAHLLQVEEGTPTLYKERTVFAEDGMPLEYQECHSRGDKYSCTVILRR